MRPSGSALQTGKKAYSEGTLRGNSSAGRVLTSGAPVTVVPLDLTRQTLLRPEDNERFIRSGDRMIEAVGRVAAPWLAWVMAERKQDGSYKPRQRKGLTPKM